MKVISLLQPWATLVVMGAKKIETRSWNTKYRGPLLIHASVGKKPGYKEISLDFQQQFFSLQLPHYKNLPFGAIIGKVNLVHTVKSEHLFFGNEFEWIDHSNNRLYKFYTTNQELSLVIANADNDNSPVLIFTIQFVVF